MLILIKDSMPLGSRALIFAVCHPVYTHCIASILNDLYCFFALGRVLSGQLLEQEYETLFVKFFKFFAGNQEKAHLTREWLHGWKS